MLTRVTTKDIATLIKILDEDIKEDLHRKHVSELSDILFPTQQPERVNEQDHIQMKKVGGLRLVNFSRL